MIKKNLSGLLAAALLAAVGTTAEATVLTGNMTVDNSFQVYISTQANQLGTQILSGNSWTQSYALNFNLAAGQNYYLHVVGGDVGVIAGFLGQFALSDNGFSFANGLQNLSTGVDFWQVNRTGYADAGSAPIAYANNGGGIWGRSIPGIGSDAQWIWDASSCTYCTAFFSTQITATDVPEPAGIALLGLGLLGLAARRRG